MDGQAVGTQDAGLSQERSDACSPETAGPHRVAVLVRDGVLAMELGLVHRLFGEARAPDGAPLYSVTTCAVDPGEVRTDADFTLNVPSDTAELAHARTVIVPSSRQDYHPSSRAADEQGARLAGALRGLPPGVRRIASICSGAFVLASAGLLDGRRATTHWRSAGQLRSRHPQIEVDPDVLYVDEGTVLTSAGVASGIDLCLHMIRCDHGAAVANEVARGSVVPPHREGGQAQFVRRPVPQPGTSSTGAVRRWALDRLHRPLTLAELAECGAMSVRTFNRRFREEVGETPLRWLTHERVERARRLLEESDLPVERIAEECGFGTAASLRVHFRSALQVSPSAYRRTFRGSATAGRAPIS
ncbi:GlxA family transcriptional regulator [Streptomyces sulphureus]|uniref:GlxA family transcriptional regulator n=1 Tax=Streptomyces sulphureus TaxID=47758 RepID=UPI00035F0D7C|nr:helix-turn-helix domain-containing protein [Streptomyces sulphureus]